MLDVANMLKILSKMGQLIIIGFYKTGLFIYCLGAPPLLPISSGKLLVPSSSPNINQSFRILSSSSINKNNRCFHLYHSHWHHLVYPNAHTHDVLLYPPSGLNESFHDISVDKLVIIFSSQFNKDYRESRYWADGYENLFYKSTKNFSMSFSHAIFQKC